MFNSLKYNYKIILVYSFINSFKIKHHYQQLIKLGADQIIIFSSKQPCLVYNKQKKNKAFFIKIKCTLPPQSIREYTKLLNLDVYILRYSIMNVKKTNYFFN